MKHVIILAFVGASICSFGQSKSFQTLKEKFSGHQDVTSFGVSGIALRTALWLAAENDWCDEIGEIRSVRLINIPQKNLTAQNLKISGFKKLLSKDNFEEMINTRDGKDHVTVYMQENNTANRYLLLIENEEQITAIEIVGHLDPKKLIERKSKEKFSSI